VKLVQTLVVRDDADVVDAQIAYHLNAGVDFVIAAVEGSRPAPKDVLDRYVREGYLRVLSDGVADAERRTRMARLAATEHGADWVINSETNEFWWPRGESLKDVLAPIPPRYTIVQALRRELVAQPGDAELFADRMTRRRSLQDGSHNRSPASMLRPVHRADPEVVVHPGGTVEVSRPVPLRAWYPIEVFQLPTAGEEELPGDSLVEDTRLRDALRSLREDGASTSFALPSSGGSRLSFRTPDVVDDAAYAVDCAAVGEVDLPRLEEYVTELEQRIGWLEQRFWPRALRSASRLLRRRST
jgi:hypothetical protein